MEVFYELTPRQFDNIATGYNDKQERLSQQRWEQSRWIAYWAATGHLRKGTQPRQLMPFCWDEEQTETLSLTEAEHIKKEVEQSKALWKKIDNNHGKPGS